MRMPSCRFPAMTLRAALVVPPMVLSLASAKTATPSRALGIGPLAPTLVPMRLPWTGVAGVPGRVSGPPGGAQQDPAEGAVAGKAVAAPGRRPADGVGKGAAGQGHPVEAVGQGRPRTAHAD